MSDITVIGSGFAGLSAASLLSKGGNRVTVLEKNSQIGGRARRLVQDGFAFDMGPSWYWMPDVYEKFYNLFGRTTSDFYELTKLDPGFKVIFGPDNEVDIPADYEQLCSLFENIESGSSSQLRKFMKQAEYKYNAGMNDFVYRPGHSIKEYFSFRLMRGAMKLQLFSSFSKHVRKYFSDSRLIAIMEFPVLFLGAMPEDTPALYSLMNFAGLKQGTFYPVGGFGQVVDAFKQIADEEGVVFKTSENVESIEIRGRSVTHIRSNGRVVETDAVVATADYHHVDSELIPKGFRNYDESYWEKRVFAPSSLIFYLGVNKKVAKLVHHNLFFDEDLDRHASEIYRDKKWPTNPLFYVCCPSKTDLSVAPDGFENLFLLMPIATGLLDTPELREEYYERMMDRIQTYTGEDLRPNVVYKKSYCLSDFVKDYNSYKGNAYGLANTLFQTAIFKPRMRSNKIDNLFFAGQLTVPGPGVPPSIISGQVAANELLQQLNRNL